MKKKWHFLLKDLFDKKHIIVGIIFAFILFGCLFEKSPQIGIVNVTQVYEKAAVFKAIHEQQIAFEDEWKKEALAQKELLEKEDSVLSKKKARLKRAKFEKEVKALKERILDFQNQQMAKLDLIRHQTAQIQRQVSETMKPLIAQVAKSKDFVFVLSSSEVLYNNDTVDITADVIHLLDEVYKAGKLPKIQISLQEGV